MKILMSLVLIVSFVLFFGCENPDPSVPGPSVFYRALYGCSMEVEFPRIDSDSKVTPTPMCRVSMGSYEVTETSLIGSEYLNSSGLEADPSFNVEYSSDSDGIMTIKMDDKEIHAVMSKDSSQMLILNTSRCPGCEEEKDISLHYNLKPLAEVALADLNGLYRVAAYGSYYRPNSNKEFNYHASRRDMTFDGAGGIFMQETAHPYTPPAEYSSGKMTYQISNDSSRPKGIIILKDENGNDMVDGLQGFLSENSEVFVFMSGTNINNSIEGEFSLNIGLKVGSKLSNKSLKGIYYMGSFRGGTGNPDDSSRFLALNTGMNRLTFDGKGSVVVEELFESGGSADPTETVSYNVSSDGVLVINHDGETLSSGQVSISGKTFFLSDAKIETGDNYNDNMDLMIGMRK